MNEDEFQPLFPLGQVVATPGALQALEECDTLAAALLFRHNTGDWGDLDADDKRSNTAAVKQGSRVFSAYMIGPGIKIWVITEADRSSTTLLLPEEY